MKSISNATLLNIPPVVLEEATLKMNDLRNLLQPYLKELSTEGQHIFSRNEKPADLEDPTLITGDQLATVQQLNPTHYSIYANKYAVILTVS